MPPRFPRGWNLRPLAHLVAWRRDARRPSHGSAPQHDARIEALESRTLLSTSWFVASTGSDNNPGTLSAPFRTIQHAANIARAGDHVEIRAGVYHETVTTANSGTPSAPIVFEAYNNERVTVSGADPVSSWSYYGSAIYRAAMPWTLGEGNDQVFVDGQMINEARFPNTNLDVSHPTLAHAQKITLSGSNATLYDSALDQPAGFWKNATIHIAPGEAWIAQTGTVTNSGPGWLTFSYQPLDRYELPQAGDAYYLTGTFHALDAAGEWFRDNAGSLYMRMPASDSPALHDIEVKRRRYAFDVSGRHDITIQNVNLFADTINSDAASSDLIVNHINAQYTGQFLSNPSGWDVPNNIGIVLAGANSVLENSTIAFSAGDGVLVTGSGSRVTNNFVHDVDYTASDAAGIRVLADNVLVDHNTVYNTGRDGILHQGAALRILYNTIDSVGMQTTEAGGIYTVHQDGGGTRIAFNTVSSFHSGGFGHTGIYLDNYSGGYIVDHNVVTDVDSAMKLNFTSRNNSIYNNTLGGTFAINSNQLGDWNGTRIVDNVLTGKTLLSAGVSTSNNLAAPAVGVGAGTIVSGAILSASAPPPPIASDFLPPGTIAQQSSGLTQTGPQPPEPGTDGSPDPGSVIQADRAAIQSARQQLLQHQRDLLAQLRAHLLEYRGAQRQAAKAKAARALPAAAEGSALSPDLGDLRQTIQEDRLALAQTRQADQAAIVAARKKLATDLRSIRSRKKR